MVCRRWEFTLPSINIQSLCCLFFVCVCERGERERLTVSKNNTQKYVVGHVENNKNVAKVEPVPNLNHVEVILKHSLNSKSNVWQTTIKALLAQKL